MRLVLVELVSSSIIINFVAAVIVVEYSNSYHHQTLSEPYTVVNCDHRMVFRTYI